MGAGGDGGRGGGSGGTGVWGPSAPVTQPAGRTCRGLPCRLGAAERRPGERMGRRHGGVSYTRSSWEPARVSSKDLVLGEPLPRGRGGSPETGVTCPLELGHGLGTACRSASLRPTWSVPGPVDFCRAAATQGSRPAGGSRWGRPGGNVTVAAQRGPSVLVGAAQGGPPGDRPPSRWGRPAEVHASDSTRHLCTSPVAHRLRGRSLAPHPAPPQTAAQRRQARQQL